MSKEKNKCAPPINQIYFYLTESCNLCCRHCWIAPKDHNKEAPRSNLSLDAFTSVIEQAKPLGLTGVKLTGGEPLLHPKIHRILEFIRNENMRLTVETNGVLCTPRLAKAISLCKNPFVAVSLDSPDAKVHDFIRGVSGAFDKTIKGISHLVNSGLKPQIIMTIMKCNKNHSEDMVHLAETLGCGSVKFNIVQPTAKGKNLHESQEVPTIKELIDLGNWVEETLSQKTPIRLHYSHPPAFRSLGKILGDKSSGCGVCGIRGILGVIANGSYALCGIGETVPELVFGNVLVDSLRDVWHNAPILIKLRQGLPGHLKGICGDCIMKNLCLGSCIAQNYYCNKDLWAPFWYCKEAHSQGLFPESRISLDAVNLCR